MQDTGITSRLLEAFESLPAQHRTAARWMLDNPEDVALLSMREQAKRAGVPAATMTRLAQRFGFDGFDALREVYAASLRGRPDHFAGRAEQLQTRRSLDGDAALAADMLAGFSGHLAALGSAGTLDAVTCAASIILEQDRLFCVGARSGFTAAYLGSYLLSLVGENTVLIDGAGSVALDNLRDIGPGDAVLALTIKPYTRLTVEAVSFARERGASIIALTDSVVSPIARDAAACILLPTSTPSFIQSVAPAVIMIECIAALVAARRGKRAVNAIAAAESHLERFGTYVVDKPNRGQTR